jgi:O-antigen ligase
MKNEFLNIFKERLSIKISLILLFFFPIILLTGSAIINLSIVLINIFFLIHIIAEKKFIIFCNDIFYFLIALWFFLILNTLLNDNFDNNFSRSFAFIRFILLIFSISYFFSYKNFQYKKLIFKFWTLIFAVVSLDLIFEFFFGFNTLGFRSTFDGRLSGFMGDQLKIGHWYLCFSLIVLSNHFNQNKTFYFIIILSIAVSFLIGERANFFRMLIAFSLLIFLMRLISIKNLALFIVPILIVYFIINQSTQNSNNALKYRYFNQIYNVLILDSFKEINNNNSYTPMYVNAYDLFKKNKLLGVGVGSYLEKSHENFRKYKTIEGYKLLPNTHPHQFHFEILATLGLPGYIFISFFLLYFLFKSLRFYIKKKNTINLNSFLFVLVFCIPLLPTGSFFTTYGASMFWLNFTLMNFGNFKNLDY